MSALQRVLRFVLASLLAASASVGLAQTPVFGPGVAMPDKDTRAWLLRIQEAAKKRNFSGTFVFSAGGAMSSARITHYATFHRQGQQQFERVDSLDGPPRQLLRHNDTVHTVWPQSGLVVVEKRDSGVTFPALVLGAEEQVFSNYEVLTAKDSERVAGHEALVLLLRPKDLHRYGYRLWSDKTSGLLLRADVLGERGEVLESSAFSEVTIGVKAQPELVLSAIKKLAALRVVKTQMSATTLEAHGWQLRAVVPGFKEIRCFQRPWGVAPDAPVSASTSAHNAANNTAPAQTLQVIYSDGLTHVSLFVEPFDGARHGRQVPTVLGATKTFSVRQADWWITAVGDVPLSTLRSLALGLQRLRQ
ncbi:MAG: MucB/RseB C-terminal domain-containing protein [Burkholderiales bacterium]